MCLIFAICSSSFRGGFCIFFLFDLDHFVKDFKFLQFDLADFAADFAFLWFALVYLLLDSVFSFDLIIIFRKILRPCDLLYSILQQILYFYDFL